MGDGNQSRSQTNVQYVLIQCIDVGQKVSNVFASVPVVHYWAVLHRAKRQLVLVLSLAIT